MSTLRITLAEVRDLGSPSQVGAVVGRLLSGLHVTITPTTTAASVNSAGLLHSVATEDVQGVDPPWSYDLVDPTDADPSGWGYRVRIAASPSAEPVVADLDAEAIAAITQVDGVRLAPLVNYIKLAKPIERNNRA